MEKFVHKHKRRYIEIKQDLDKYNTQTFFKPKLKLDNLLDKIDSKLSLIELDKSKIDNSENIPLYIITKMLTKFNYYYQRYIENAPHKNTKVNKSYKSDKKDIISDINGDINQKEKNNNAKEN